MSATKKIKNRQPGDLTKEQFLDQVIRVDHAGEYGAKRIYAGQMAVLKNAPCFEKIKHMAAQEDEHLAYFTKEIGKRNTRPTVMMPLWHIGAYAMGAGTALLGEKAAMACTVAVEEVIDEHYQEQLDELAEYDDEEDLRDNITKFREEELEHRDIGLENKAEEAPGYVLLRGAVRLATKVAIEVSKRV